MYSSRTIDEFIRNLQREQATSRIDIDQRYGAMPQDVLDNQDLIDAIYRIFHSDYLLCESTNGSAFREVA